MDVALGYYHDNDEELTEGDPSKPPASGIEYLLRVQREAEQCPDVVMARPPHSTDNILITNGIPYEEQVYKSNLPLHKSQLRISADFACLRQKLLYYKTKNIECGFKLPSKNNLERWMFFCFGHKQEEDKYIKKERSNGCNDNQDGHPPLLSILQNINQPLAVSLLERHLKYFQMNGFTSQQGHWFFALLLCIDKPTPPEILSLLRDFARQCLHFRDSLTPDDIDLIWEMNLFIVLVSKYFGQADLSLN